jgi:hypothetical protein
MAPPFEKLVGSGLGWAGITPEGVVVNFGNPWNMSESHCKFSYPQARLIPGGHSGDGKIFYVCEAFKEGTWHPGYMADMKCEFGWGGGQESFSYKFMVLGELGSAHYPYPSDDRCPH